MKTGFRGCLLHDGHFRPATRGARRRAVPARLALPRLVPPVQRFLGTYQFVRLVRLRLGDHRVLAVEIISGEEMLVGELLHGVDRAVLCAWLAAHGFAEIQGRGRRPE